MHPTYPNIVISCAGRQAAFAIGLEMGRVDGVRVVIVVVPVYDQRSRLHCRGRDGCRASIMEVSTVLLFQSGCDSGRRIEGRSERGGT